MNKKTILIMVLILPVLISCETFEQSIYKIDDQEKPFAPREYYRASQMNNISMGVALMNSSLVEEGILSEILSHKHINDAVVLRQKDKYYIAVKPKRFSRPHSEMIKSELTAIMANKDIAVEVFTKPRHYRLAKQLSKKRSVNPQKREEILDKFLQKK
ncbi:hypothetical protein CIB95_05270 [Lottiidibacillus patelloidae]|uniref:Sporulation protein n=1 Tax=Lottiidibacillus patelloidae TaxID=2670334 RepID=A0A263BWT2_9BACI|nr:hypothetical protein [Lottiidibacillus patelloidae]OZM57777.1 hypothetical protein CIB95_05270 [Lottiidibacillus patelloidae]